MSNLSQLWKGVGIFISKDMLTRSAALAYYSIFSLPPILVIVIYIFNRFSFQRNGSDYVFRELSAFIGKSTVESLQQFVNRIEFFQEGGWQLYVSGIIVLITSTTVFAVIQNGFNHIFDVEGVDSKVEGVLKYLLTRLVSLTIILGLGFLMIISLILDVVVTVFAELVMEFWLTEVLLTFLGNFILPLVLMTLFFITLFRFLPDVYVSFRNVWKVALMTAVLFVLGKYVIGYYVATGNFDTVYENAASVVIILVWVYYGSAILFFGCSTLMAAIDEDKRDEKSNMKAELSVDSYSQIGESKH